jgi:hypothetical protein
MRKPTVTKEECENILLDIFNKYGRLTETLISSDAPFTRRTVRTHFCSLTKFKQAHNLKNQTEVRVSTKGRKRKIWTKEECLEEARRLESIYGKFSKGVLEAHGRINHKVYVRLWGSFQNFYDEISVNIHTSENIYSDEQLFESLRSMERAQIPISINTINEHALVSHVTYIKRYGSIQQACEFAGVSYNRIWVAEKLCIDFITGLLNEKPQLQFRFSDLRSPKGGLMPFDAFYIKHNLLVEYNGRQHYQFVKHFHGNKKYFLYRQECDHIKYEYCKQKGIKLLIIRYDDTEANVLNKLHRLGFSS